MKKLELIIGGIDTIQVIGKVDLVIKDISKNSNNVDTNYLFVAIEGNEHDGHSYIQNAIDTVSYTHLTLPTKRSV